MSEGAPQPLGELARLVGESRGRLGELAARLTSVRARLGGPSPSPSPSPPLEAPLGAADIESLDLKFEAIGVEGTVAPEKLSEP